jgi:rifampin ADP-ribosylating transferase
VTVTDESSSEQFYHGTKADLKPGDLIKPGRRPNFGYVERRSTWVYLTATLDAAIWAAEPARGEGPGRVYVVEPTGPMIDDPDLTDKRFSGNPTKSFCSRDPLRVTSEVTHWRGHTPEALKAMRHSLERVAQRHAALVGRIPSKAEIGRIHDLSDVLARAWASDAQYLGSTLLMLIRGADVEVSSALEYRSCSRGETHTIHLPTKVDVKSRPRETADALSGRVTDVTGWREGWAATLESCVTEIGLASEVIILIAVDAKHDKLTFHVEADGPDRSWLRDLLMVCGVLSDRERGETWRFGPASP